MKKKTLIVIKWDQALGLFVLLADSLNVIQGAGCKLKAEGDWVR